MENLQRKIAEILNKNINDKNPYSVDLHFKITDQIMREIINHQNDNYNSILDFCEIVDKEKNGLLFIKKMIRNLII